jgi:uncharacterized protein (TIGR01319 family)
MSAVLCVDVGSTFTKAVLVDDADGTLLATASHPTTLATDVLDGVREVRERVEREALPPGARAAEVLACSSAGGGLRIAVVGYERQVTAEAGYRVALSAGGRVVHVHAGPLDDPGIAALRRARPDVVLLAGGTDGGNAEVLLHNARRLASTRIGVPIVLAGNADAADEARAELGRTRRRVTVAANVLPRIGVLDPVPARTAIREVFLRHVIGGKGLSRGPAFGRLVRAATPDVVLAGVEVLADGAPDHGVPGNGDVLVVDVGGATTDVYSVVTPRGEDAELRRDVVATLWRARTVEGDLGLRWNAPGVVEAALAERLLPAEAGVAGTGSPGDGAGAADGVAGLRGRAARLAAHPGFVPGRGETEAVEDDVLLARLAVTVAARRHGRPATPAARPRPLREVGLVVGSGGVLRHGGDAARARILAPLLGDHGGGWVVPEHARLAVDGRYTLFAAGLLAPHAPAAAARLARTQLTPVPVEPVQAH